MRAVKGLLILAFLLMLGTTAFAQEDLTETFTAADNSYTFDHPRRWTVFEVEDTGMSFLSDGASSIVATTFAPLAMETLLAIDESASIEEALEAVVAFFDGEMSDDPESDSAGGRDLLFAEYETADGNGWAGVVEFSGGGYGGILVTLTAQAPDDAGDTLAAILATFDVPGGGSGDDDDDDSGGDDDDSGGDDGGDANVSSGDGVFEGDGFAFQYPDDWFVNDSSQGIITLSNDEDAAAGEFPDEGYLWLAILPPDRVAALSGGASDAEDIFDEILGLLEYEFDDIEEIEVGDRTISRVELDVTQTDAFAYVVPFSDGDSNGFVVALAPAGEFEDFEDEFELIVGSLDNEVEEASSGGDDDDNNVVVIPDGDFPARISNTGTDFQDTVDELLEASVIPEGGELVFDDESLALDGEVDIIEDIGGRTELTNFVLSGELTFEAGGDDEDIEICVFSVRYNRSDSTFIDIGMVNTGTIAMLDRFDVDEDSNVEVSTETFELGEPHHFLIVMLGNEMTVYVDGDLVFERVEVVDREGSFGVGLVGAGRRASCEAEGVWVFSLDNAATTTNNSGGGGGDECVVTPTNNDVNVRSGPGTEFAIQGTLSAGDEAVADGQATASLGAVWWRLEDGGWVRFDLVDESASCADLPTVTP